MENHVFLKYKMPYHSENWVDLVCDWTNSRSQIMIISQDSVNSDCEVHQRNDFSRFGQLRFPPFLPTHYVIVGVTCLLIQREISKFICTSLGQTFPVKLHEPNRILAKLLSNKTVTYFHEMTCDTVTTVLI
jgi:hypothetical protein